MIQETCLFVANKLLTKSGAYMFLITTVLLNIIPDHSSIYLSLICFRAVQIALSPWQYIGVVTAMCVIFVWYCFELTLLEM